MQASRFLLLSTITDVLVPHKKHWVHWLPMPFRTHQPFTYNKCRQVTPKEKLGKDKGDRNGNRSQEVLHSRSPWPALRLECGRIIHLFNQYLFDALHMPDVLLEVGDKAEDKNKNLSLHRVHLPGGRDMTNT